MWRQSFSSRTHFSHSRFLTALAWITSILILTTYFIYSTRACTSSRVDRPLYLHFSFGISFFWRQDSNDGWSNDVNRWMPLHQLKCNEDDESNEEASTIHDLLNTTSCGCCLMQHIKHLTLLLVMTHDLTILLLFSLFPILYRAHTHAKTHNRRRTTNQVKSFAFQQFCNFHFFFPALHDVRHLRFKPTLRFSFHFFSLNFIVCCNEKRNDFNFKCGTISEYNFHLIQQYRSWSSSSFLYTWNQAFVRLSCLIYFLYHLSVIDWDSSLCILIEIKHCYLIQKPEKQSKTLTLWSKERRSKKEWNKTWHGRQTVKAKVTLNMHVRNCLVDRDMSQ